MMRSAVIVIVLTEICLGNPFFSYKAKIKNECINNTFSQSREAETQAKQEMQLNFFYFSKQ